MATETWTGKGYPGELDDPKNWSGGSVPGAGDTAVFDSSATVGGSLGIPIVQQFSPSVVSVAAGANVTFTQDGYLDTYTIPALDIADGATVSFVNSNLLAANVDLGAGAGSVWAPSSPPTLDFSKASELGQSVNIASTPTGNATVWSVEHGFGAIALAAVIGNATFGSYPNTDFDINFGSNNVAIGHWEKFTEGAPGPAFTHIVDVINNTNTPSNLVMDSSPYTALFGNDPSTGVPCFVAGTFISTPDDSCVPVESLWPGDEVHTVDGLSTVRWVGHKTVPPDTENAPILVRTGALFGLPRRPLWLSPDHAVFTHGVLIPIHKLVNGTTILPDPRPEPITYIHIELERHCVLYAEGLSCESFLDTGNRGQFDTEAGVRPMWDTQRADVDGLTASLRAYAERGFAALCLEGPVLEEVRARLLAQRRPWRAAPLPPLNGDEAGPGPLVASRC